jgi:hypothetical protein
MPISGLVVTLADDSAAREVSLAAMREHPALEIGELNCGRVPVVVDSADEMEDRLVWDWLHSLPGVALVVVAFISFDDESSRIVSSSVEPDYPVGSSFLSMDREP